MNSEDLDGETALFIAIRKKQKATVKKLIESGADVNTENKDSITPLREAVWSSLDTCLDALITAGADVNHFDFHGICTTAVIDIVEHQNMNCLTILLEAGADVNKTGIVGKGALH